jgi:hypothetical protein
MRGSHRLCATAIRGVAKLLLVLRRIILDNFELQGCTAPKKRRRLACFQSLASLRQSLHLTIVIKYYVDVDVCLYSFVFTRNELLSHV